MRWQAALVMLAILATFSSSASASGFVSIGRTVELRGDGAELLAWQRGGSSSTVEVLGTTSRLAVTPPAPGCSFEAVGAGTVVFDCYDDTTPLGPRFVNVTTGAVTTPPGVDGLLRYERANVANDESYQSRAIGSRVLEISVAGNHVDSDVLLDVVDGTLTTEARDTPLNARDLDVPGGRTALCAPLRRPRVPDSASLLDDDAPVPAVATYRPPYLTYLWRGRVVLKRCGTTRKRVLGGRMLGEPVLTRTFVAWGTRRAVHLRALRTGRTAVVRYPRGTVCSTLVASDRYVGCDPGSYLAETYLLDVRRLM